MNNFSNKKVLQKLFLFSSIVPLVLALISQYVFGLKPCELCIYQRIPYFLVIAIAIFSLRFSSRKSFLIAFVIIIHAFLVNAVIAFYHIGVENFWWVFGDCSSEINMNSIEDIRKSLSGAAAVRCDEVQFSFLGLSMAAWNFVYSTFMFIFLGYNFFRYVKAEKSPTSQK